MTRQLTTLTLCLLLASCTTHKAEPARPAFDSSRNPDLLSPDLYPNGVQPEKEPVVRYGRYTLVSTQPDAGQRDLMAQIIDVTIPSSMNPSVKDAMQYVMSRSGYSLCPAEAGHVNILYTRPLPAAQYKLGPMTLRNTLQVLSGPAWQVKVDEVARQVCFVLRPGYQLPPAPRPKPVQQLVNRENESITKQVLLNVNVLSVALTDKDQLGIDWNLVYKSLNNKWGIGLKNTMPGIDQSAISGSVSILDTANSAWAGSKAMVQALAQQGRVSTVRSPSVTTLNLQSAPIQIGRYDSYLASSQISNVAQVGSTTSLIPGAVTSGYNMSLLPFVMESGEMLLKININMTSRPTFEMQTSGDSKAQFPSYDIQLFDQKVRLRSGETLVLSGFDQTTEDTNKVGTGDAGFFGLGGGLTRNTKREVIVVLITPVVLG
ncbi:PilN family type IVB pilus formation outer membrane protein [Pseudomonas aeruginosa]